MTLNCKNIIVSAFKITEAQFNDYFDEVRLRLDVAHPGAFAQRVKVVSEENFVNEVLADPENVGICYTPIGLAESSSLNRQLGVRAAIVHNIYLAYMCREHNDANILVLGVDCLGRKLSGQLVMTYLNGQFDHQVKNKHRIALLHEYQKENPVVVNKQ